MQNIIAHLIKLFSTTLLPEGRELHVKRPSSKEKENMLPLTKQGGLSVYGAQR